MALLKIPINLPPRQIRLDRRASSASTLSNSSEGDDVFYQRLGVSKSSSSKIPHSVKVRPSHEHNIKKDFNRSQGLQGALERIQKRRSSDPLYQGEKGADTKEVKQMIDLFSKYEGILEHLVHKNQKLKSFVNGETEVYPSQFSCTTVEILETLEKLNLKRAQSFANPEVLIHECGPLMKQPCTRIHRKPAVFPRCDRVLAILQKLMRLTHQKEVERRLTKLCLLSLVRDDLSLRKYSN
jgi:hypothetical protein